MLLVLFEIGDARYGLDAREVIEIVPDAPLRQLPGAPAGVAGLLTRADGPIPVIDVSEVITGVRGRRQMSTRILVVPLGGGPRDARLGLRVEGANDAVHVDPADFRETGVTVPDAPCLGPVIELDDGLVQRVEARFLLTSELRASLFAGAAVLPQVPDQA